MAECIYVCTAFFMIKMYLFPAFFKVFFKKKRIFLFFFGVFLRFFTGKSVSGCFGEKMECAKGEGGCVRKRYFYKKTHFQLEKIKF